MPTTSQWMFGPFRLDLMSSSLWREDQLIPLRPKACAILAYLVAHADQVVTKKALFEAVWPETAVTDGALKTTIDLIRQALGDSARQPQYIGTVHRRGYRFIAPVTELESTETEPAMASVPPPSAQMEARPASVLAQEPRVAIARETAMASLEQRMSQVLAGERQVVYITGESGIGKTTLVDAFVTQVSEMTSLWIGSGQCIEQYGEGEAYLPLLEALGQMCRSPNGTRLVELLRHQAPSWLQQLPAFRPVDAVDEWPWRKERTTRGRMLRELTEALEILTVEQPLVLVLEDLHWSDVSTIEWLAYVARRRQKAHLLVLGTYRPEAIGSGHPLSKMVRELQVHQRCVELEVAHLSEADVARYLAQRFASQHLPKDLPRMIQQRTSGNPLFMVTMLDAAVQQGTLSRGASGWELPGGLQTIAESMPKSVQQLIEQQIEQLSREDQTILEAASVAGVEFSVAEVTAASLYLPDTIEVRCSELARQGKFVRAHGAETWPDGTVSATYSFRHVLHHEVFYTRVSAGYRVRMHQQIGLRKEASYGDRVADIAAELAAHFTLGQALWQAVKYRCFAGEQALQRSAHQEAIRHLTHALDTLQQLPVTPEHTQQELRVRMSLGPALMAIKGYGSPEVARTYEQAQALCQQVGETPALFPTLWGIFSYTLNSAQHQAAQKLAKRLLGVAQQSGDPALLLQAHHARWSTALHQGALTESLAHLKRGMELYTPRQHHTQSTLYGGHDPGVCALAFSAVALWCFGYADQAVQRSDEGLALAQELGHPLSLATALNSAAVLHLLRGEAERAQAWAEAEHAIGLEHEFQYITALGLVLRGWALSAQHHHEGIVQLEKGIAALWTTGTQRVQPIYRAGLVSAYAQTNQVTAGLQTVAEALTAIETTGERLFEAELHRLQGELLLQQPVPDEAQAETCFHRALAVAGRQQARGWELRAAISLSRLWLQQGKGKGADAHQVLEPVYNRFTEGFTTPDLQVAKALLDKRYPPYG